MGTIDEVTTDQGQTFFHVTYPDFDEEELDLGEVWKSACYHPELDAARDGLSIPTLPPEGSVVLYSANYEPRLGKVVELREDLDKPVVVQLWKPKRARRGPTNLIKAKFTTHDTPEDPERSALSLSQIRLSDLHFDGDQRLDQESQRAMEKALRGWRRRVY